MCCYGVDLQIIQSNIYEIRGQRVMLDFDLAMLYNIETRVLNQAVKRNIERFPPDFIFQLTQAEWENMSSQFVMTSRNKRPKSALPQVFTEHGVVMLSSVLRSDIAIQTSILIAPGDGVKCYSDRKLYSVYVYLWLYLRRYSCGITPV